MKYVFDIFFSPLIISFLLSLSLSLCVSFCLCLSLSFFYSVLPLSLYTFSYFSSFHFSLFLTHSQSFYSPYKNIEKECFSLYNSLFLSLSLSLSLSIFFFYVSSFRLSLISSVYFLRLLYILFTHLYIVSTL